MTLDVYAVAEGDDCPECQGVIILDEQEARCEDCGLVVSANHINHGPSRSELMNDKETRTGPSRTVTRHDRGMSPTLRSFDRDGYGNQIDYNKRKKLRRMKRLGKRLPSKEKNKAHSYTEIKRVATAVGYSDSIQSLACQIFDEAHDRGKVAGRSLEAMSSAAVYAAHRLQQGGVQLENIAAVSKVDKRAIRSCYKMLSRDLQLPIPAPRPRDFIGQAVSELDGVGTEIRRQAEQVLEENNHAVAYSSRSPRVIAAAAIYSTTGPWSHPYTTEVADVVNVTADTVRRAAKDLFDQDDDQQTTAASG